MASRLLISQSQYSGSRWENSSLFYTHNTYSKLISLHLSPTQQLFHQQTRKHEFRHVLDPPLRPNWGSKKTPSATQVKQSPQDLQKILSENLGFEHSHDEVPISICERFCAWGEDKRVPKDVLILRFNRGEAYNKRKKTTQGFKRHSYNSLFEDIKLPPNRFLPPKQENEYICSPFDLLLFQKVPPSANLSSQPDHNTPLPPHHTLQQRAALEESSSLFFVFTQYTS